MRVVVFEDDTAKKEVILAALEARGVGRNTVRCVANLAQFAGVGADVEVDLFILDLRMPGATGADSRNVGLEILEMLDHGGRKRAQVLAITAYPEEAEPIRDRFAERGCIIFDFEQRAQWGNALDIFLAQAHERGRYDFIIFTALEEERMPYSQFRDIEVKSQIRNGLNVWETELDGRPGAIFMLPHMGLVNASIVVSRVLENYSPSVVAMSGICAGLGSEIHLGQLLVADVCFEYQSGKWLDEVFLAEPYQVAIPPLTRPQVVLAIESPDITDALEAGFKGKSRPGTKYEPKLVVFATGSAVIASDERIDGIRQQHRKVRGLDMEAFGFMKAAELSGKRMHVFCAKVVVDKAGAAKGDEIHEYGSYVSARFTIDMVGQLLAL
ncbi:response regulator receiver protein [Devosia sp. ZW T5_3]|uniref:phosphorylase family protein n=1 Tax=Devosia sp. ZW T5_3 TaxID=3378085 RepID=UPI003852C0E3